MVSVQTQPRRINRTFRIVQAPANGLPGQLRMVVDGRPADYQFSFIRVPEQTGLVAMGFLKDQADALYHVVVRPSGKGECDCMGFLRWGHCRHADVAAPLILHLGMAAEQA